MYSVVGSDGQVYGPVDMATLTQWIRDGRVVATTNLIDPLDGHVIQASQAPALYGMFGNAHGTPPVPGAPMQSGPMQGGLMQAYGYPRHDMTPYAGPPKQKLVAILLAFFLGGIGIHRFYLGHNGTGIAMLALFGAGFFTCGLTWFVTGIWAIVDIVLIATDALREPNGRALT